MMRVLLVLTIFLGSNYVYGQKYGNIWQFGNQIGLDFNTCKLQIISGNNTGFEGCSTISDSTGQLLFYTNSDKVWDKSHAIMANGDLISTGGTLSQVIIIPKPLSWSIYYIITTKIQAQGNLSLQYHVVDMTLNNGLGEVSSKNNILSNLNVTEQISATYHHNGTDIWLMTHEYGTNKFLAYLVTSTGISEDPIISTVGLAHEPSMSNINARGEIKFSPNGYKLAFNANGVGDNDATNILTLLDFDKSTGQVSNPIELPFSRGDFGLSFSPDNSKLYGATWKAFNFTTTDFNYLYQFDLSDNNAITIIHSKQIIDSVQIPSSFGTLKIGPDGKIYVRYINSSYLGVINSPNLAGDACNYEKEGLYIGYQTHQYGLNNYIEYTQYCNDDDLATPIESDNIITLSPNPFSTKSNLYFNAPLNNASLIMENYFGQIVLKVDNINGFNLTIHRHDLSTGLYLVRLIQDNKIIGIKKILIID